MSKGIQSIEIGFTLIDSLVENAEPMTLKSLAQASQMTPSKARMYLISLLRVGVISQDPESGLYALGPYAIKVGMAAVDRFNLMKSAREVMSVVSRDTFAPVMLSSWTGESVSIIGRSETPNSLPMDFRIGGTVSLSHTATGWVFLAFAEEKAMLEALDDELGRNAKHAETARFTRSFVDTKVNEAKASGFSITKEIVLGSGVVLNGYGALALPLCDGEGKVRFVLTALYTRPVLPEDENEIIQKVAHLVSSSIPGPIGRLQELSATQLLN